MSESPEAVEGLTAEYRAILVQMHAQRVENGGKPGAWNRLADRMRAVHLRLRTTQAGRDAITSLINDENPTVQSWSAVNALGWAEGVARAELEREADADDLMGFGAKITLREFDAGRLNTSWVPKGHCLKIDGPARGAACPDAQHTALEPPSVTCNTDVMSVGQRVTEHRRRMRERGYRPLQIWVPDVRSDAFADEAHRQSARLAAADRAGDDQDFVEAISVDLGDEE